MFGRLEIQVHQNPLVYLGFGEQNFPYVQLLPALFDGLAAGMLLRSALLRFEANFNLSPFGSEL